VLNEPSFILADAAHHVKTFHGHEYPSAPLPFMELELASVDWSSLEHAYGTASDIPDMLRGLRDADPEVRDRAWNGLHASLDHQGVQRGEATWRAVPFLIDLVRDASTPGRGDIARLLAEFAVGDTCWFLHDGVHPEQQMNVDDAARAQHVSQITAKDFATRGFPRLHENRLDLAESSGLRWIYDAVAAGVPALVAALDGADEHLRTCIPFACAFLTTDDAARASAPALTRLLDDPSERVRASAALGLSHATKFVPELWEQAFAALSTRWARGDLGALERRGLALALVRYEQPARTAAVRAYLREALSNAVPAVIPDGDFPWFRIDSPPFVFCTTWLGTDEAERPALRAPALAALAQTQHHHDAADLALWIARIWTPPPAEGEAWRRADVAGDLLATLRVLANAPAAWFFSDLGNLLHDHGFEHDRAALAAWLDAA
jgi:hypothetical protein